MAVRGRSAPISGLLLALCWAPMAVAIPMLPDLGSVAETERFWEENLGLMQGVICSAGVGYFFLLVFLSRLGDVVTGRNRSLGYLALGSALMFMTLLNVALGLDLAAGLLLEPTSAETTHALHSAAFLLAAPAAPAGVAFFVAAAVAAFRERLFPPALGWLAVLGAVANAGALGGMFALTGPLNSGNGLIGGIAAPLGLFVLWIVAVSLWWLVHGQRRPDRSPDVT